MVGLNTNRQTVHTLSEQSGHATCFVSFLESLIGREIGMMNMFINVVLLRAIARAIVITLCQNLSLLQAKASLTVYLTRYRSSHRDIDSQTFPAR